MVNYSFDRLSVQDQSDLIREFVKAGIYDLNQMKNHYEKSEFKDGGHMFVDGGEKENKYKNLGEFLDYVTYEGVDDEYSYNYKGMPLTIKAASPFIQEGNSRRPNLQFDNIDIPVLDFEKILYEYNSNPNMMLNGTYRAYHHSPKKDIPNYFNYNQDGWTDVNISIEPNPKFTISAKENKIDEETLLFDKQQRLQQKADELTAQGYEVSFTDDGKLLYHKPINTLQKNTYTPKIHKVKADVNIFKFPFNTNVHSDSGRGYEDVETLNDGTLRWLSHDTANNGKRITYHTDANGRLLDYFYAFGGFLPKLYTEGGKLNL